MHLMRNLNLLKYPLNQRRQTLQIQKMKNLNLVKNPQNLRRLRNQLKLRPKKTQFDKTPKQSKEKGELPDAQAEKLQSEKKPTESEERAENS